MIDNNTERHWEKCVSRIRQLSDNEGYFQRVYEILPDAGTLRAAWEATEAERAEVGLPERYSSYESFRRGKNYHKKTLFRLDDALQDVTE